MAEEQQNIECHAGDIFYIRLPISDDAGTGPASFVAPVAYWALGRSVVAINTETPILAKNSLPSGGASIVQETITAQTWWVLYVYFSAAADTQGVGPGVHYHEARIVDGSFKGTIMTGSFTIKPTIIRD